MGICLVVTETHTKKDSDFETSPVSTRTFSSALLGSIVGRPDPTPTCLASSRTRHTMALGSEHSPLLVGDEPEESPSRTSMRRALRFAGASPDFRITPTSEVPTDGARTLASPVASTGDVRVTSVTGSRSIGRASRSSETSDPLDPGVVPRLRSRASRVGRISRHPV